MKKRKVTDEELYYMLGKRDSIAETLMELRLNKLDLLKTIKILVEEYEKFNQEPNPHCEWFKKNYLNKI